MTTAWVIEMSVTVNNSSPILNYSVRSPDNHTHPTYEMTPVFKPFTKRKQCNNYSEQKIIVNN